MLSDVFAVAGLIALLLVWLALQRWAARHRGAELAASRWGACGGDCGGARSGCPRRPTANDSGLAGAADGRIPSPDSAACTRRAR